MEDTIIYLEIFPPPPPKENHFSRRNQMSEKDGMPRNYAIRATIRDRDSVNRRLQVLFCEEPCVAHHRDIFFNVDEGRLKLRITNHEEADLIFYRRGCHSRSIVEYETVRVRDPCGLKEVLGCALGIAGEVVKTRLRYSDGQTRVHCDQVRGLGDFLEFEVCLRDDQRAEDAERIACRLMERLGLCRDNLVRTAYIDLLDRC